MPLRFQHHQLSNGLDVIGEHNPDARTFAAGLYVKTGSRDEDRLLCGISHFLEHMMFKGSTERNWEAMNRIFDELGARYNAFTTQETTGYYAGVLPEYTQRTLEHLGHLLRPQLRDEDVQTERKVILEEIAMYQDEPAQRLYDHLMSEHFGEHPLGLSVIGSNESVGALTRQQLADYFSSRYGPGNMVLAVSGCFDFDEIQSLAERYYGRWKRVNAVRHYTDPTYRQRQVNLIDAKLNRQYTMALAPAPDSADPRRFAARVLCDVIGDAEGSRLYWALVDNAIAEEADFGFQPHDRAGSYYLSLVTDPDRADEALEIARRELQRIKSDLSDIEVDRAKTKIATGIVLGGESPMARLGALGGEWLYNGTYRSIEDDLKTLEQITPASLIDLMIEFPFSPMSVCTLGPK